MNENIRSYFEHHPTVDEFHFTEDGYAFFLYDDAYNHAQSIDSETVETIHRSEIEEREETDQYDYLDAE